MHRYAFLAVVVKADAVIWTANTTITAYVRYMRISGRNESISSSRKATKALLIKVHKLVVARRILQAEVRMVTGAN